MYSKLRILLLIWLAGSTLACASYQHKLQDTHRLIRNGQPFQASIALKEKASKESDDQVVFLLEYATALQLAGELEDSTQAFLQAEQLTEIQDYHSLSRITGSLLLNEGMVQYKGEDYEKVLINAMLGINFLLKGDTEAALVETRKLNEKLYRYRFEAKRDYEQNPFAFYLAAMIWESGRNWDSAYIDFERVYNLNPNIPYLEQDLIRAAKNARRRETLKEWQKKFPEVKELSEWNNKEYGELVLIYQQGWGPKKHPHPNWHRIPKLYPVTSQTKRAQLVVEDGPVEPTQKIYSVEEVAIKTLDDAYAELITKRVAGVVAKEVVSDQIRQKNQLLGDIAWIGMHLADQADLRQWSTLPESFQIAKVYLKAGTYRVHVQGLSLAGEPTAEKSKIFEVEVKPRQKTFLNWRSVL